MAKRKRKTLPKDFGQLLEQASLEELIAVFDQCELEATGGYSKSTALGFYNCPDELVRWLVEQGAGIDARDTYQRTALHHRSSSWKGGVDLLLDLGADIEAQDYQGDTPLHAAAKSHKVQALAALIRRGADIDARNRQGHGVLQIALATTSNADIEATAKIAQILLDAGVPVDDAMLAEVQRIGREFEFHRAGFKPDYLEATDAGLASLYGLFGVTPVASRQLHDGKAAISVADGPWHNQHQQLWQLLVPSNGPAATVQGEVIRLSGRISREIHHNGAANWDADFKAMLTALVRHLGSAVPLSPGELAEAQALAAALRGGDDDAARTDRLSALAVQWVIANPQPLSLPLPAYRR
ncbi:ankyrin repeat domain-containing protein [Pseudomonas sp. CNPSo 3701]|uniref:ankyrin repeat domain-containing protein n=1 Tax=Pseudomonas sp. CNPSo 3701 TaxID=3027943 RepID=UPI00236380EA|nr:ankyrin repeat domain-containing protein [Pseudomonas sp. CNPSo 3701]MDD1506334.1 ankyrin repeat domain-containing protein [Pseudomonas sp. CNPSo 3701]